MACAQLVILLCLGASLCNGLTFGRLNRRSTVVSVTAQDHWFEQRLDHFNGADTRVWNQRYYANDSFTHDDGPVFLMIGGEGRANPAWMTQGTWITYAQKMRALCLMLEHRFYGKSHPTENTSVANLHYLSSQQALADLAHFQVVMTERLGLGDRKWIVFGGSYPGCLSAWYRLKFPHLAHASVASSAPVQAVLNFNEYLEVVRSSLARNHSVCPKTFKVASDALIELLAYKENYEKITGDFNLCQPLEINSKMDFAFFLVSIAQYVMDVVQYNNDNRAFEGVKSRNITIQTMCDIMANESWGSPYERYVEVLHVALKATQDKCIEASYQIYVEEMKNSSWEGLSSIGGRQWVYQTCTEFGYFQSSDSTSQPFSGFPLSFYVQQCIDIYGSEFNLTMLNAAVQQTNENYGGLNIQSSRIIFPNGLIDPWHVLGINRSLSDDVVAIPMQDAAHCADMYPARPEEPPVLPAVRKQIYELLTKWLQI